MGKKTFLLLLSIIFCHVVFAQEYLGDTTYQESPNYIPCSYHYLNPHSVFTDNEYFPIDTLLHKFQYYDAIKQSHNLYTTLGQTGQAHQTMNFEWNYHPFFNYMTQPYPEYYKTLSKIKLYESKNPFSRLYWATGLGKENIFNATHAQHIKNFYVGFDLNSATNTGRYSHQLANRINMDIELGYHLPNYLWGFMTTYILNYFNIQENGGIKNMDDFYNNLSPTRTGMPIINSNALSRYFSNQLYFLTYLDFSALSKQHHKIGVLTYTFDFDKLNNLYRDTQLDTSIYHNPYLSVDSTRDVNGYYTITNTFQYSNYRFNESVPFHKPLVFHYAAGLSHQLAKVDYFNDKYQTLRPFLTLKLKHRLFDMSLNGDYFFGGYTDGNFSGEFQAIFKMDSLNKHRLVLMTGIYGQNPDYYLTRYPGNIYRWNQFLNQQYTYKASLSYHYRQYALKLHYFLVNHYTYLNDQIQPFQIDHPFSVLQAQFLVPFRIKGFCIDLNAYLQYTPENSVSLPNFAMKSSIYYNFRVFKKKMELQIGFNIDYNTPYYPYSYNANLRQFYAQWNYKLGNYMYADVFVTMKVKRLNVFAMCTQFLANAMGYKYITTPYYPMDDISFRFGIAWRFYD